MRAKVFRWWNFWTITGDKSLVIIRSMRASNDLYIHSRFGVTAGCDLCCIPCTKLQVARERNACQAFEKRRLTTALVANDNELYAA
ncbi:hypothetical protein IG631_23410 [Alternaria alternata]|nr:hypothetical protein IG631_23410 [Alternaria alternata]